MEYVKTSISLEVPNLDETLVAKVKMRLTFDNFSVLSNESYNYEELLDSVSLGINIDTYEDFMKVGCCHNDFTLFRKFQDDFAKMGIYLNIHFNNKTVNKMINNEPYNTFVYVTR